MKPISVSGSSSSSVLCKTSKYPTFIQQTWKRTNLVRFEEGSTSSDPVASSWADDHVDQGAVVALGPPEDMEVVSPARTTSVLSTSILHPDFSSSRGSRQVDSRLDTNQRLIQMAHQTAHGLPMDFSVPPPRASGYNQQFQQEWRTTDVSSSLERIERRVGMLEAKSFFDNVMMAGLKEEQDTEANRAMLNKVTMAGVEIPGLANLTRDEDRIKLIKDTVAQIIEVVRVDDHQFKVLFVRHLNWRRGQPRAVIKVKLESEQQATTLRADFVKKQKDKDPNLPVKLNIAPVVRMATRVRVEMMHSIGNLIKRRDPTVVKSLCLQYIPKPVLKIVRKTMGGTEAVQTMTFIEAVCWVKENELQREVDFRMAYERAGSSFNRVMAQTFVLLSTTH